MSYIKVILNFCIYFIELAFWCPAGFIGEQILKFELGVKPSQLAPQPT